MRLTASSAAKQTYHNAGGSPTFRDNDSTGTSKPPLCMFVHRNSSRCAAIRKRILLAVESTNEICVQDFWHVSGVVIGEISTLRQRDLFTK